MTDFENKAQLRWAACRRGMLELDILFERYFNDHYDEASNEEKQQFHALVQCQDQELFDWLCKQEPCPDKTLQSLIDRMRSIS